MTWIRGRETLIKSAAGLRLDGKAITLKCIKKRKKFAAAGNVTDKCKVQINIKYTGIEYGFTSYRIVLTKKILE